MKKRLFILIMFLVFIIPMNTNALVKPSIYKDLVKDNDFRYGYLVYPSNENYEINNFAELNGLLIPENKKSNILFKELNRFKNVDKIIINLESKLFDPIYLDVDCSGSVNYNKRLLIKESDKQIVISIPKGSYNTINFTFNNDSPSAYRIESIELLSTSGDILTHKDVSIYLNETNEIINSFSKNTSGDVIVQNSLGMESSPNHFSITGIDKNIPSANIKVVKKNSLTEVKSGSWSNEGLNFSFYNLKSSPVGASIYYCQDTDNTCIPETLYNKEIVKYNIMQGNYYLRYRVVSNSKAMSKIYSFDSRVETKTPVPEITIQKGSSNIVLKENDWSNEDIKVNIKEKNNLQEVKVLYCIDKDNLCEPSINIKNDAFTNIILDNGIYYIRYKIISRSNIPSSIYSRIIKIDKSVPEVDLKVYKNETLIEDNNWKDSGLSYMFIDNTHGLSMTSIYYCKDLDNTCIPNIKVDSNMLIDLFKALDGQYYIRYMISNESNSTSDIYSYESKVDINPSNVTIKNSKEVSNGSWTNTGLTYSFNIENSNSNSKIYYCKDLENTCVPNIEIKENEELDLSKEEGIYYIRYNSVNEAGVNSTIKSYEAKIDKEKPVVDITVVDTNNKEIESDNWSITKTKFKFNLDNIGISPSHIYYCIDQDNNCTPDIEVTNDTFIDNNKDNGTYYIRYNTINDAKTISEIKSFKIKSDIEELSCTITKDIDEWTNKDITLTVNGTSSGPSKIELFSFDGENFSKDNTLVITENKVVDAYVKNEAGSVGKCSVEVTNIDKEKPVCELKLDGVGNDNLFVDKVKLSFDKVSDNGEIDSYGINRVNGEKELIYDRNSDSNITYTGFIKDKAGNVNTCDISFVKNSKLTVTYNNDGGSMCTSKEVYYGSTYNELCLPIKNGYSFDGWYDENNNKIESSSTVTIKNNHTLTAHWIVNKYNLEFDNNLCNTITKEYGSSWGSMCIPVKEGYMFAGWFKENLTTIVNETTKVSGNLKVYPKWIKDGYKITYDNNGGYGCSSTAVEKDKEINYLCIPKKENDTFEGWYIKDKDIRISDNTIITKDIEVVARWKSDL